MATPVASAQQAAQNWQQAMSNGLTSQKYVQGVNNVSEAPNAKAAAAASQYQMGTANAVASGRYAAANNAVPLSAWKSAAVGKASRLATGAQAAAPKYQQAAARMQPVWQGIRDAVSQMPKGGEANAIARATKAIQMMMAARKGG